MNANMHVINSYAATGIRLMNLWQTTLLFIISYSYSITIFVSIKYTDTSFIIAKASLQSPTLLTYLLSVWRWSLWSQGHLPDITLYRKFVSISLQSKISLFSCLFLIPIFQFIRSIVSYFFHFSRNTVIIGNIVACT